MILIKGDKRINMDEVEFKSRVEKFSSVVIDMGTGDGNFIIKEAVKNPNVLYVGIDPAEKQLVLGSKKVNRKKLNNVLFVLGAVENCPEELTGCAKKICINLPWGTLLETVAKPVKKNLENMKKMLKSDGELEINFGYNQEAEPSETARLVLPALDKTYVEQVLIPEFERVGFKVIEWQEIGKENNIKASTSWNKRLSERTIFNLTFKIYQT